MSSPPTGVLRYVRVPEAPREAGPPVLRIWPYKASMSGMNVTQVETRGSPARDSSSRPREPAHRHRLRLGALRLQPRDSCCLPFRRHAPRGGKKYRSYIRNLQPGSSSFDLARKINRTLRFSHVWQPSPPRLQARCHISRPRNTFRIFRPTF